LNSVALRKGLANQEIKPFDVLAEGLLSEKSRGDWTPFELFLAGVQGLPATIGAMLCQAATC
jgi:hypothetical protein